MPCSRCSSRTGVSSVQPDHPALVAVGAWGLPGLSHPTVSVAAHDVPALRAAARDDRLSGLLADAVHHGAVQLAGPATHGDAVLDDWHRALRACVVLEALLVRVGAALDGAGVRWLLTKGSAVAHLDYPDPALRTFADIDLLVHPDDWATVEAHFFDVPGESLHPGEAARRAFAERYGKGRTAMVDDMEVDLHRRFAVGAFGVRPDMRSCFDAPDTLLLGGRAVPAPAADVRLLHACFHAVFGGDTALRAVRDVAQIAAVHPSAAQAAWQRAERWRVEPVLTAAFRCATRRLGLPRGYLPELPTRRPTASEWHTLRVFRRHHGFRRQVLTTLGSLPAREVVPFLCCLAALRRARP